MKELDLPFPWIMEAKKHLGLKEIPGPKHNTTIQGWLSKLNAWWKDDETPWCGVFVAHCFRTASMQLPKDWMRAKEWANNWGTRLNTPAAGCVVVFERTGGGHVGFVIGQTANNEIVVLGGNQGNMVSLSKFPKERVFGYFWPRDFNLQNPPITLPVMTLSGSVSTNEA